MAVDRIPQIDVKSARSYLYEAGLSGFDAAPRHGRCLAPKDRQLKGVTDAVLTVARSITDDPFVDWIEEEGKRRYLPGREPRPEYRKGEIRHAWVRVPCRKCDECLKHRRRLWTARAMTETRNALRTWFGTLTVSPDRRFHAMMLADRKSCGELDKMTDLERTRAVAAQLAPEVTRWLKRVRKESGAKLRYLLVVEPHQDGFPHFHMLLHEVTITPVPKRILEAQWSYGFSSWRLVPNGEMRQVSYVCKYLTKSAQTRVRASRHYGQLKLHSEPGR